MKGSDLALVFRAGSGILAALPARHIVETMRPLVCEPLTGAPDLVIGATVLRGRPAPVVDAAVLLGAPASTPARRWIGLDVGGRAVALAVSDVIGLRQLPEAAGGPALPPLLATASRAAVGALSVLDGELLVVLAAARLVPDDVWRSLESAGDRRGGARDAG